MATLLERPRRKAISLRRGNNSMWAPDLAVSPRDPADTAAAILPAAIEVTAQSGWSPTRLMLVPYGAFRSNRGAGPWVLEGKTHALDAIGMTREFQRGLSLSVDYDHQTLLVKNPGFSYAGYVDPASLTAESDGIYGEVVWTPVANRSITQKEYRYYTAHVRALKSSGRITRLLGAGLTNTNEGDIPVIASVGREHAQRNIVTLTDEERAVCAQVGASEAEFLAIKAADASGIRAAGKLSADELAVCAATGCPPEEFLAAKDREAAERDPARYSKLSSEERAVCAAMGYPPEEFLAAKISQAAERDPSRYSLLSSEERAACAAIGCPPEEFLAAKASQGAERDTSRFSQLTDEERAMCSAMRVSETGFLKARLELAGR